MIRDRVGVLATAVDDVRATLTAETRQRELWIQKMEKYTTALQGGITILMDRAKVIGIRNTAQLQAISSAVPIEEPLECDAGELPLVSYQLPTAPSTNRTGQNVASLATGKTAGVINPNHVRDTLTRLEALQ